jgi:hypothetical protein
VFGVGRPVQDPVSRWAKAWKRQSLPVAWVLTVTVRIVAPGPDPLPMCSVWVAVTANGLFTEAQFVPT